MKNADQTAFPTGADNPNYQGLTKREYFAAMAMQGLLANPSLTERTDRNPADDAIIWADHLLSKLT